jgi:hypothetical protein
VLSRFVVRFWRALHNLVTAEPSEDFLQAGRLFALFVHGGEQAPKRFNLAILLIWHGIMMSKVVKRFTVYFVLKSQQVPMKKSALNLWRLCPLRISYSYSTVTNDERMQRESSLIATVRRKLPDFVKACADDTELVLLHQDAFAADYQDDEYLLLGMAIKYAVFVGRTCV